MKTIPDYYEIIFAAFLKALRRETYTGTYMIILSGMMLYNVPFWILLPEPPKEVLTMAEMMINGDNLIRYCMERRCGSVPIERIKSEPRIEVERVRHARWINNTFCSDCKRFPVDVSVSISNQELTKYFSRCPHCGAVMDAQNGRC